MSRAPGINRRLVLPPPPDKYDPADQREVRRLLVEATAVPMSFDAVNAVPTPVSALGGLTGAADTVPYFSGVATMVLASLTPYARTIIACVSAATMRTALGLGSAALNNTSDFDAAGAAAAVLATSLQKTSNLFDLANAGTARTNLGLGALATLGSVTEALITLANNTTNDVSTTEHGFAPKAPNDTTKFLRGDATWAAPASAGGGGSPAILTDTTDLAAWFSADNAANTVAANTGIITAFGDKTGNGHTFTPGTGTIVKQYAQLAGSPVAAFVAGLTAVAGITIPLKGAMTFFGVFKITSSATYQNLFKPSLTPAQPNDMHFYWDQPSGRWQVDGSLAGTAPVAGAWATIVAHFYNTGSVMHFKVRQNGAQILGDTASTNGSNPVPGTSGSPVNFGLNLFLDSVANNLKFLSQIAEWGFYAVSKDGTEGTLESYLRAKYSTW
jgi:hypothetical protein